MSDMSNPLGAYIKGSTVNILLLPGVCARPQFLEVSPVSL